MARPISITVQESKKDLQALLKSSPLYHHSRIRMLLLIQEGELLTKESLALSLGVSDRSIQTWRSLYREGGIGLLLHDKRTGYKKAAISGEAYTALEKRLNSPVDAFRSFVEAQQWLSQTFGIEMEYHALNKFIKRKFKARLKAGRKSHVDKNPVLVQGFKKTGKPTETN